MLMFLAAVDQLNGKVAHLVNVGSKLIPFWLQLLKT